MGEVYRAKDLNLARDVAIKVLLEPYAQDLERLARFEREAKILASLNHSNIAIIHGFEKTNDIHALVMERVEGETLADRIARAPISVEDALLIARQIAEALEAAHGQAIIHRDLKPANVKLRPDGTVKVRDFGLARALDTASHPSDASQSPTIADPAMTRLGVVLGTAAYLSPEQTRGKPVDKRADTWAFGCVLYEMLTGRRTFDAPTTSDILARVLAREPDFDALPAATPDPIRRLLRRCLRKDRKDRLHDIADARIEIDEARELAPGDGGHGLPVKSRRTERVAWLVALVSSASRQQYSWRRDRDHLRRRCISKSTHPRTRILSPSPSRLTGRR
jgi:serine/threonine protein kinase